MNTMYEGVFTAHSVSLVIHGQLLKSDFWSRVQLTNFKIAEESRFNEFCEKTHKTVIETSQLM
jgi:hypothetical protein